MHQRETHSDYVLVRLVWHRMVVIMMRALRSHFSSGMGPYPAMPSTHTDPAQNDKGT